MRFALLLVWTPLIAQSIRVYSEFAQIDAKGEATAPAQPREILSPAIVRNGFTSFQIAVQVEPGTPYWLHVGENPEGALRVTVYRESGEKLEPIQLPYAASSTQVFWMDLWADRDAPVRRVKVQPQINVTNVNRDWVEYPMEVRVMDAVVPEGDRDAILQPLAAMRKLLCAAPGVYRMPDALTRDRFHARNAQQDVALAQPQSHEEVLRVMGGCQSAPPPDNPEWYLKIRDYLFRLR